MPRKAKPILDVRSLARSHTMTAVNTLKGICLEKKCPPAARVSAAIALLDRGWGKPVLTQDITVRQVDARQFTDDELAAIASGGGEGDIEAPPDPAKLN